MIVSPPILPFNSVPTSESPSIFSRFDTSSHEYWLPSANLNVSILCLILPRKFTILIESVEESPKVITKSPPSP